MKDRTGLKQHREIKHIIDARLNHQVVFEKPQKNIHL